jgi:L,D-transpeptidase YbiS
MTTLLLAAGYALLLNASVPSGPDAPSRAAAWVDPGVVRLLVECATATHSSIDPQGDLVYVSVSAQQLVHIRNGNVVACYPVSTARAGTGNTNGSGRTPTGLHRIKEKIGANVPQGGILVERRWEGRIAEPEGAEGVDLITSRILWLEGQEEGVNRGGQLDSAERYIYIHGTADSANIGRPASHGCVRMLDGDVVRLFDALAPGTPVLILP